MRCAATYDYYITFCTVYYAHVRNLIWTGGKKKYERKT